MCGLPFLFVTMADADGIRLTGSFNIIINYLNIIINYLYI